MIFIYWVRLKEHDVTIFSIIKSVDQKQLHKQYKHTWLIQKECGLVNIATQKLWKLHIRECLNFWFYHSYYPCHFYIRKEYYRSVNLWLPMIKKIGKSTNPHWIEYVILLSNSLLNNFVHAKLKKIIENRKRSALQFGLLVLNHFSFCLKKGMEW